MGLCKLYGRGGRDVDMDDVVLLLSDTLLDMIAATVDRGSLATRKHFPTVRELRRENNACAELPLFCVLYLSWLQ